MTDETRKRWIKSLLIALVIFIILSMYLFLRRGYYNLFIINKVLGSEAAILAGITLLIGPLRSVSFVAPLMTIRRQLGLLAFGFAVLHIIASLYQTERFKWFSWYQNEWIPVAFGILAIVAWVYMTYISRNKKIEEFGVEVWKRRLSLAGKVGFLAIFIHVTVMKYEGWIRWVNGQVRQTAELANPQYPPASLFVFLFMLIIILSRLIQHFVRKGGERV